MICLDPARQAEESGHEGHGHDARILIVAFFRTASSLLEELRRSKQDLLGDVAVVDFNPHVHATLRQRGIKVCLLGTSAIRRRCFMLASPRPRSSSALFLDALLKGTTNAKLVRHLREINPEAKIIAVADILADVTALYAAGADYVSVARLEEAAALCEVLDAIECNLLDEMRAKLDERLAGRQEVLP